jgi:hypothetical protein
LRDREAIMETDKQGSKHMIFRQQQQQLKAQVGLMAVLIALMLTISPWYAAAQDETVVTFPVGQGFNDVIPHQIVRTADDQVYIFAPKGQYIDAISAYWTEEAGLPSEGSFTGQAEVPTPGSAPISVDAVYDGETFIHVLVNFRAGVLADFPFDTSSNMFLDPIIVVESVPGIEGDYIGTSGISGMFDQEGNLHIVYWSNDNHISHNSFTYNSDENTLIAGEETQVDSAGQANHPIVAVSPLDDSVTVAWVSEASSPARILARTRDASGEWGDEEIASTAPVWTSVNFGINIDQGPSLVIGSDGTHHLAYIENYDSTNEYGHVHYVTKSPTSGWVDTAIDLYSHDPAMAITDSDQVYLIGHGAQSEGENVNIYTLRQNEDGSFDEPQLFAQPSGSDSYDASPSVKWSVVGWNRPETVEFLFFAAPNGDYSNTTIHYGRLEGEAS